MSSQFHSSEFTLVIADGSKLIACREYASEAPSLSRLAGRGVTHEVQPNSAQMAWTFAELSVLRCCGLLSEADRFPSAAMCAIAAGHSSLDDESDYWIHADAVHFSAGLNDIAGLQLRGEARVNDEEHATLSESLRSHLSADCDVLSLRPGNWLMKFSAPMRASTRATQHAFRGPLQEALPSGPDGAQLRRIMTELQMVVHDHEVNRARARYGLPAINAVWLWGLGEGKTRQTDRSLPQAFGNSEYLKGLYSVHGKEVESREAALETLLKNRRAQQSILVVSDVTEVAELQSKWFGPLERALRAGMIKSLVVEFDRWRTCVTRADVWRIWRRAWNQPEGVV